MRHVARILIADPSAEICELIAHVVARLGHEPAVEANVALALALQQREPGFPVVCESVLSRGSEVRGLDVAAYLVKPFGLAELERVLSAALDRPT